jgi:SAM-dependent methyltransferase
VFLISPCHCHGNRLEESVAPADDIIAQGFILMDEMKTGRTSLMDVNSNLENYIDPVLYDLESDLFEPEGTILLDLSQQANGPILELGCGTGRITIPLAQRGIDITGIDFVPQMLGYARRKAGSLPINWVCADVRYFNFNNSYALIFSVGAVIQHLISRRDQEAMLARVHSHLATDGIFVIDAAFSNPASMVDIPAEKHWYSYSDDQGRDIRVLGTDKYDHIQQIWFQSFSRRRMELDGSESVHHVDLALRYFMPQEMEALLHYNGFQVIARYGDWIGNALTQEGAGQIYVCKKKA